MSSDKTNTPPPVFVCPHNEVLSATDEVPLFSLNGVCAYAKIVHVYDGDTFRACFMWEEKLRKFQCRSMGYDSPEMRPLKSMADRDSHIERAKAAWLAFCRQTGFVQGVKATPIVFLQMHGFDKYGRLLATVYPSAEDAAVGYARSINQWMVDNGHGVAYDGGTKKTKK